MLYGAIKRISYFLSVFEINAVKVDNFLAIMLVPCQHKVEAVTSHPDLVRIQVYKKSCRAESSCVVFYSFLFIVFGMISRCVAAYCDRIDNQLYEWPKK